MNINNALDDLVHRIETLPLSAMKDVDRRRVHRTTEALLEFDDTLAKARQNHDSQEETK